RVSPTATNALNENRRPPFTTLATRLISITFSTNSLTSRSRSRSRPRPPLSVRRSSELQSALAGAIGHSLHAAMISIPGPVEHHRLDARALGLFGEQLAGGLAAGNLAAALDRRAFTLVGDADEHHAAIVVDQLGVDVLERPEHHQARATGAAGHFLPDPKM